MAESLRMEVDEARRDSSSGRALLVCAYADEARCRTIALEGSMSLAEFESRVPSLSKNQKIIFFCA
jgi:hypothetical protein